MHGVPPYKFVRTHKKPSPEGKGDRSRWMRGAKSVQTIGFLNIRPPQPPRLHAKDHLSEAPSEEGAPPQAVREFPFQTQSNFSFERGTTPVTGTYEQAREFNATLFCGRGLLKAGLWVVVVFSVEGC